MGSLTIPCGEEFFLLIHLQFKFLLGEVDKDVNMTTPGTQVYTSLIFLERRIQLFLVKFVYSITFLTTTCLNPLKVLGQGFDLRRERRVD